MSTENIQQLNKLLGRLIFALESKGFKKHGRATQLSKITGYSVSMVSDILRGKAELSDRFLIILCREIGLSENWIRTGEGEMFEMPAKKADQVSDQTPEYSSEQIDAVEKAFLDDWRALDEVEKMRYWTLLKEAKAKKESVKSGRSSGDKQ